MANLQPRLGEWPAVIPIFPLAGALLLPHGRLPLNIFEPRYLAMVEAAMGQGRLLGMVQGDDSRPRGEHGAAVYSVGCLGRISSFSETEDGRFLITLTGLRRFRAGAEQAMRQGFRRMEVDYVGFEADPDPLPVEETVPRAEMLAALRPYFGLHSMEVNWEAIEKTPEAMLVNTLSMLCPFAPAEKQALLEAGMPAERTAMLMALLQMALHGEAGQRHS